MHSPLNLKRRGINSDDPGALANLCRRLLVQGFISAVTWRQVFNRNGTRLNVQVALRERNLDAVFFELMVDPFVEPIPQDHDKFR